MALEQKWEYGKLTSEVDESGKSRFFFHSEKTSELKELRDYIMAMNLLGRQGWECLSVSPLTLVKDEEFDGISSIREAFFKRHRRVEV
ncbi:MAG: hypothetical protein COB02_14310 [Candidatus Cloacimonadota bacterium]|nr:MAG: hypothetical protein COB02_14310 [Candidatus Cloacimonadota bacterium]